MFVVFASVNPSHFIFARRQTRRNRQNYSEKDSGFTVDDMSKRQPDARLDEELLRESSPVTKKARVEDGLPADDPRSGAEPAQRVSGQEREMDERNGNDILAAADEEHEEILEGEGDDASELEDNQPVASAPKRQTEPMEGYSDLYLDTINRTVLDFDFEKLCSVSLSNINVYACLVCGKYFQGRGPKSHAYFHALDVGHHVFINMGTKKVYVLPEGYEVKNKSLDDIKYVVDPHYTKGEVMKLDKEVHDAFDLSGDRYRPGMGYVTAAVALLFSMVLTNFSSLLRICRHE